MSGEKVRTTLSVSIAITFLFLICICVDMYIYTHLFYKHHIFSHTTSELHALWMTARAIYVENKTEKEEDLLRISQIAHPSLLSAHLPNSICFLRMHAIQVVIFMEWFFQRGTNYLRTFIFVNRATEETALQKSVPLAFSLKNLWT